MIDIGKLKITHEMLLMISSIERFQGSWTLMIEGKESQATILRAMARIASIGASGRIEGSLLKDYEVEKVLGGVTSTSFRESDIIEARGYASALDKIAEEYEILSINESVVEELHAMITGKNKKDFRKGEKPEQNILSDEPSLDTAPPNEAPFLMRNLIEGYEALFRSGAYHPLILIPLFIADFISINPFQSANGRTTRLISTMLMLKAGYSFISYYPFDAIMEETRKSYMFALKKSQEVGGEGAIVLYFLKLLEKTAIRLNAKLEKIGNVEEEIDDIKALSPLERDIIKEVRDAGMIYTAELASNLRKYKLPTLKKALRALVAKDELEMLGTGRGTYYRCKYKQSL